MEDLRINFATEASDKSFHLTKVCIFTFIKNNPWFDGIIYLLTHRTQPLSTANINFIKLIYPNIKCITVSPDIDRLIITNRISSEKILNLLKVNLFLIPEKILYCSNSSVFLNNCTEFLVPKKLTISSNNLSIFYKDSNIIISSSVFVNSLNISNIDFSLFEVLNNLPILNKLQIPNIICFSSRISDKSYHKFLNKLELATVLLYDRSFIDNANGYLKINQLWMSKHREITNFLSQPKNIPLGYTKPVDLTFLLKTVCNNISIIIPAHEAQNYIEECLDSISIDKNIEILIGVDNCEKTLTELLRIRNKYSKLRIFKSSQNVGPYVIRNTLANYANFENFLFFDADDIMNPRLLKILSTYANNNIVRFKYLDFKNGTVPYISKDYHKPVAHGVFYIPKVIFNKIGGFQDWKCGADTEFIKRCEKNRVFPVELNEYLFYRRIHNNSLTQNINTNYTSDFRKIIRRKIKMNTNWTIPITKKTTNLIEI